MTSLEQKYLYKPQRWRTWFFALVFYGMSYLLASSALTGHAEIGINPVLCWFGVLFFIIFGTLFLGTAIATLKTDEFIIIAPDTITVPDETGTVTRVVRYQNISNFSIVNRGKKRSIRLLYSDPVAESKRKCVIYASSCSSIQAFEELSTTLNERIHAN